MDKIIITLKKLPKVYFLILYTLLILAIIPIPYIFSFERPVLYSISLFFAFVVVFDVLFLISHRLLLKRPYVRIPRVPFDRMYMEPHPYLPYVYKKNFLCQKGMPSSFPLNREKGYMFAEVKSNNFRHINGPEGDRDIDNPKPKNLIRINCLGSSITGNYIRYEGKNYSYPLELEKILHYTFPRLKLEVNNCGQGGYTSAEILIKFLLDTIDTQPDIIVLYHGYQDLIPSLTPDFNADYSHARRNLGEVYYLYRLAAKIPNLPFASWNFLINYCLFSQNIRFSLLKTISRGEVDLKNNFQGLDTYRRNMEHILHICKANNIQVIISTFCHYLYRQVQDKEEYLKYSEGVALENNVLRSLAAKHNLRLVDNAILVPKEEKYFLDTVHFTPEGMHLVAVNIARPIIEYIRQNQHE